MDYDKVLETVEESIKLHLKAIEKLTEIHTSITRKQQAELYGEPNCPVITGATLRQLKKDLKTAEEEGQTTVLFRKHLVTLPYAEYLLVTYK